jgi:hypothetical protein
MQSGIYQIITTQNSYIYEWGRRRGRRSSRSGQRPARIDRPFGFVGYRKGNGCLDTVELDPSMGEVFSTAHMQIRQLSGGTVLV